MGSKLSFYRRSADITDEKLSEALNNLKVTDSEPAQTSEPTPISADNTEKVEPKCDSFKCVEKDLPEKSEETRIQTEVAPEEQDSDKDVCQPASSNEGSATESSEQPKEQEKSSEEGKAEETNAEVKTEEKQCLCNPCECKPCKCCGNEVEGSDNSPHIDSNESEKPNETPNESQPTEDSPVEPQVNKQPEADIKPEESEAVNQESDQQIENPVEESRATEELQLSQNEDTKIEFVSEPIEEINDNIETPQESNQSLEMQLN